MMDDAIIFLYHREHLAGRKANGQFTQEAFRNIVNDLWEKFPYKPLDKEKIRNRMKNIKKSWQRCYDIFKGGLSGFGWDPVTQNWTAEPEVWKQLIEEKLEAEEWMDKSFRHYHIFVELYGKDRATSEGAMTASDMRMKNLLTENDDSVSNDNTPLSGTKSQTSSQATSTKRQKKLKVDDEQSSKLDTSISILAEAFKDMVDKEKFPITVDELWDVIGKMELDEGLAGDDFVFLLERPMYVKGLISTPTVIRKSILLKMMRDVKK